MIFKPDLNIQKQMCHLNFSAYSFPLPSLKNFGSPNFSSPLFFNAVYKKKTLAVWLTSKKRRGGNSKNDLIGFDEIKCQVFSYDDVFGAVKLWMLQLYRLCECWTFQDFPKHYTYKYVFLKFFLESLQL